MFNYLKTTQKDYKLLSLKELMPTLTFETLTFRPNGSVLNVDLLRAFTTAIPTEEVEEIAPFEVTDAHTLTFNNITKEKAELKFSYLLNKHFDHLKTKLTGNKATYVHRNSGIPLIGNVAFGIVYRNSSIIEIKPVTSCNLDCVYCSISEGLSSKKHDFVVEKEYLMEELQKLAEFAAEPVEVHIGVQGEPFMYADIESLFADLEAMESVHTVSIDTNGTVLNRECLDRLSNFAKLQLNLSLDAIDPETAKTMAGTKSYNIGHIKEVIAYAAERMPRQPIVAPVLTQGFNEQEMEKIIRWVKTFPRQPILGIQNFLRYKTGRNPAKDIPWERFYSMLQGWEKKHGIKLRLGKNDFNIRETKELPKPFHEGDEITATIKCPDRFRNSVIAAAKSRSISVPDCEFRKDKSIRVKILRDKHNIFVGRLLK